MKKTVLLTTGILCAISIIVMMITLVYCRKTEDFSPPPFDSEAQTGIPNVPDDLGYAEMDAKAFLFAAAGELTLEDEAVDIWLTNSEKNSVWLKVRVYDADGNVLGESGLIRPGEYVRTVKLDKLPQETVSVVLKIMAYEPETYYSAGTVNLKTTLYLP